MRIERSVIRRRVDQPQIAEGERVQVEIDPKRVLRVLQEARGLTRDLERLFGLAVPERRRRGR